MVALIPVFEKVPCEYNLMPRKASLRREKKEITRRCSNGEGDVMHGKEIGSEI